MVNKLLNEIQEKVIGDNATLTTIAKLTAVIAVNISRFMLNPQLLIYMFVFISRQLESKLPGFRKEYEGTTNLGHGYFDE